MFSDLCSQLVHTSKEVREIWTEVKRDALFKSATDYGSQSIFGLADSPWNQGAVEALIKSTKRCFKFSIGGQRISASEFLTVCYEAANVLNESPSGKMPGEDGELNILTPNCLLLGRSMASLLDCSREAIKSQSTRLGLTNFWKTLNELYAPLMVHHAKWKVNSNYKVGDVVQVSDSNSLRSQCYIAQMAATHPDKESDESH